MCTSRCISPVALMDLNMPGKGSVRGRLLCPMLIPLSQGKNRTYWVPERTRGIFVNLLIRLIYIRVRELGTGKGKTLIRKKLAGPLAHEIKVSEFNDLFKATFTHFNQIFWTSYMDKKKMQIVICKVIDSEMAVEINMNVHIHFFIQ